MKQNKSKWNDNPPKIAENVKVNLQYYQDRIILKCIQHQYMSLFCTNFKLPKSSSHIATGPPLCGHLPAAGITMETLAVNLFLCTNADWKIAKACCQNPMKSLLIILVHCALLVCARYWFTGTTVSLSCFCLCASILSSDAAAQPAVAAPFTSVWKCKSVQTICNMMSFFSWDEFLFL